MRLAPMERALVRRIGLIFCTPAATAIMIGNMPWLTPKAILEAAPMPNSSTKIGRIVTCGRP